MMLSRIARGLYDLGRAVERAQHVVRILEVNHKMNLERTSQDDREIWGAISDSFGCGLEMPEERGLYEVLVLSRTHVYSVARCIAEARDEGRAMRDHISEEMWLHLNRAHLDFKGLTFERIMARGRSEFNREIEVFADALHGLADDTMIRGEAWAFLRIGKFVERSLMVCRILEIKRKSISAGLDGGPVDVHQWQVLLRSLSGYEPYRRAYDARIAPERVLEFVLQRPDFPRSLSCTLIEMSRALEMVSSAHPLQARLDRHVARMIEGLRTAPIEEMIELGAFEKHLRLIEQACGEIADSIDLAYFTSLRPTATPISVSPGAGLVPQQ